MTTEFNKNDKQIYFNQVKGIITELNDGEKYCSVTLKLGHENLRYANLVCKKIEFDKYKDAIEVEDKVTIKFYITSRFKNDRWFTSATIMSIDKEI